MVKNEKTFEECSVLDKHWLCEAFPVVVCFRFLVYERMLYYTDDAWVLKAKNADKVEYSFKVERIGTDVTFARLKFCRREKMYLVYRGAFFKYKFFMRRFVYINIKRGGCNGE